MALYPIQTMGIKVWCSDLIIDPQDMETVYFLSVCGFQVAVKAIVANLLENYGIRIEIDEAHHNLHRTDLGYRVRTKKLPSGLVQAVIIPKLALPNNEEKEQNRFLVITREEKEILPLFFRNLDDKTEIPLHPSWASWLWKTFEDQDEWLVELKTLAGTFKGYLFDYKPTQLHDLISKAFRKKVPEIVQCMTWKGGNGNEAINLA